MIYHEQTCFSWVLQPFKIILLVSNRVHTASARQKRKISEGSHIAVLKKKMSKPMWKWSLSHRRAAKAQTSLRIRAVWPQPSLFAHTINGSRGCFRQGAEDRSGRTHLTFSHACKSEWSSNPSDHSGKRPSHQRSSSLTARRPKRPSR